MFNLTPPTLETLHTKPSWLNRANRIDRAACLELRCSDIWPSLSHSNFEFRTSNFLLTLPLLTRILRSRPQPQLAGHHRTKKSNAMKHPLPSASSIINHKSSIMNSRVLALPDNWSQQLTIQRTRLHSKLAQHFFLCPACAHLPHRGRSVASSPPGGGTSNHGARPRLPGRFLKLFLPLPTPAELRDSQIAYLWLNSDRQITKPQNHQIVSPIIARYSILFPTRLFLCRHCLGLRYGEVKSLQPKHRPKPDPLYANLTPDRWQRLIKLDNLMLGIANDRRRFKNELAAIDRMMSKYK